MKSKVVPILLILFILILSINLILLQQVDANFKPLGIDNECTKLIYQSRVKNDFKIKDYDKYEYIDTLHLSDSVTSCKDLQYIQKIYTLNLEMNDGNTQIIDELPYYTGKLGQLTLNNTSNKQLVIDLMKLPQSDKVTFNHIQFKEGSDLKNLLNTTANRNIITINHIEQFDLKWLDVEEKYFAHELILNNVNSIYLSSPITNENIQFHVSIDRPGAIDFSNMKKTKFVDLSLSQVHADVINQLAIIDYLNLLTIKNSEPTDLSALLDIDTIRVINLEEDMMSYGKNPEILAQLKQKGVFIYNLDLSE